MSWGDYFLILAITVGCMLASRTLPILLFSNRTIPPEVQTALQFIPVAAFAALVANDLFNPEKFALGLMPNVIPLIAAIPVVLVAYKSKSLWLCIVVGVATLAILQLGASLLAYA
jgi:branched-subunit amino acid transport protein